MHTHIFRAKSTYIYICVYMHVFRNGRDDGGYYQVPFRPYFNLLLSRATVRRDSRIELSFNDKGKFKTPYRYLWRVVW